MEAYTFKIGRKDAVYIVSGSVSYLKIGDQSYLVDLKGTDDSNSRIVLHKISTRDEDEFEEERMKEPETIGT